MSAARHERPVHDAPALGEAAALELGSRWADAVTQCDAAALVELADPNIALYPTRLFGDRGPYLGHHGLRRWVAASVAKDFLLSEQIAVVRPGQAGTVVALGHVLIDDKPVSPLAMTLALRDGKVIEAHAYLTGEADLAYLGLVLT